MRPVNAAVTVAIGVVPYGSHVSGDVIPVAGYPAVAGEVGGRWRGGREYVCGLLVADRLSLRVPGRHAAGIELYR